MRDEKVVSIEDRLPKLKQRRRKRANRRLIFYLSLFFILICLMIYLQSPLSHVKDVEVSGNSYLSKDDIVSRTKITDKTNIWKERMSEIQERLLKEPVVKSVHASRKLPWTISIQMEEYKLVGYVKEGEDFKPLLENGVTLEETDRFTTGDAPLLMNFSDKELLKEMTNQLQKLPPNILRLISEIHSVPEKDHPRKILLYMVDGFVVDGSIRNFGEDMQIYPSIVSQLDPDSKGIIHIGASAYFKRFQENENEDIQDQDLEES